MYENLYSYNEKINGREVWMVFKPNFREAITLINGKNQISSDGKVTVKGEPVLAGTRSQFPEAFVSEDAQWAVEDDDFAYIIYVTERTNEIITPFGLEWNKEFNRILKRCKDDYYKKKKKEIRLYFYDAVNDKLKLCYLDGMCSNYENYSYSLNRYFSPYCSIDKRYTKPDRDCFIFGRVRKTIGLRNSKLLDFIEPVYTVKPDFERESWDILDSEYRENIYDLEEKLYKLLKFTVTIKRNELEINRVKAYLKCEQENAHFIAKLFTIKIMDAFSKGDVNEIRQLYDVLITPQDCTNVRFKLKLGKEVTCESDKKFNISFENGEYGYVSATWIYKNIHNCTDASAMYLGKVTNRYNFY